METKCFICNNFIVVQPNSNYCVKCSSKFDNQMKFIPSRHNWNLEDYSKNFLKDSELSHLKHQN